MSDGRTATQVNTGGAVTHVTTQTISQGHGVNSFSQFDVGAGATVNLHVPVGTAGTVNIVNGGQSQIHGLVQSMQGGAAGGDVYFANPNGFVVGPGGQVTGGRVSLSTPSQAALDGVFARRGVDGAALGRVMDGSAPLGPGDIVVEGQVSGTSRVDLRAGGRVRIDGSVEAGSIVAGAGYVQIEGRGGVSIGGRVQAHSGAAGARGHVGIRSGAGDVVLHRGARVLSTATGAMAGGVIAIFAEGSALLDEGALISAATTGSGAGGFVSFSARNTVRALGDLQAYSVAGPGGQIVIDPILLEITSQNTAGADLTLIASDRIVVVENSVIDTSGNGGAGDITLIAPNIELEQGTILRAPGAAVMLTARLDDRLDDPETAPGDVQQNALPIGSVSLRATGAVIEAGDVTLQAIIFKDNIVDAEASVNAYADSLFGPAGAIVPLPQIVDLAGDAATAIQARLDAIDIENLPAFLSATAQIALDDTYIKASGDVTVQASATTSFEILPDRRGLALAIAGSNTVAQTIVHNTAIDAAGTITVRSDVVETQRLAASSGAADADGAVTAVNLALAASLRRARAQTIVNGVRPVSGFDARANTDPDTSNYIPWNPNVGQDEYAILVSDTGIVIASEVVKDITATAEALVSGDTRGLALTLSVDDTTSETQVGGHIVAQSGDVAITAETRYARLATRARVSGGVLAAEDVEKPDGQAVTADAQADGTAALLDVVAVAGDSVDLGDAASAITGGGGDGDEDNRFAAALSISSHTQRTIAGAGGNFEYLAPDGSTTGLHTPEIVTIPDGSYGRAGGNFWGDPTKVDLTAEPVVTIAARNVFEDIRQESFANAGSIPAADAEVAGDLTGETEATLQAEGGRVGLLAITIGTWNVTADATIAAGTLRDSRGWIRTPADVEIIAENRFAETEGRDEAGDWWEDYRTALIAAEGDDAAGEAAAGDNSADARVGRGLGGRLGRQADGAASLTGQEDPDAPAEPDAGGPESGDEIPAAAPADTRMFLAETVGLGTELGAGISVTRILMNLDANVTIADAYIERETYYRSNQTDVLPNKDARLTIAARNVGDILVGTGAPGVSTGGEKGGYGASVGLVQIAPTARARMTGWSELTLPRIDYSAVQDLVVVNTARAHAQNDSGGTALVAGIAVTRYDAQTRVDLDLDYGLIFARAEGTTTVAARDISSVATLAGSGAVGAKNGLSFGVAVNVANRSTAVLLTDAYILGESDITVAAETSGAMLAVGTASARDTTEADAEPEEPPSEPPADGEPAETPANDGKTSPPAVAVSEKLLGDAAGDVAAAAGDDGPAGPDGRTVAIAGDFAGTFAEVTTRVVLEGSEIATDFGGDVVIDALTDVQYGQASAVTAAASGGVGVTGSFGLSLIDHVTETRLTTSDIVFYESDAADAQGSTRVTARDVSVFDVLVTGRVGHAEDSWGVAVSATFNRMRSRAETTLDRAGIGNGGTPSRDEDGNFYYGGFGDGDEEASEELSAGFEGDLHAELSDGFEEGSGFCFLEVCSVNTEGRVTTILSEASATSIVTALAARDAVGAEASGGQQMQALGDTLAAAAEQAAPPADSDDDGTPDPDQTAGGGGSGGNTKGAGFKGLAITVAPSVVEAEARTRILGSFVLTDRAGETGGAAGNLDIAALATTDATVDATSGTIGLAFAQSTTDAHLVVEGSTLTAAGNATLTLRSEVSEKQALAARVDEGSRYKVAGILSLRAARNLIEIDARGTRAPSQITGGAGLNVTAKTVHDIKLTAVASDSTALVFAGSAAISLGQSDTEVLVGGNLAAQGGTNITARDTLNFFSVAVTATGAYTDRNLADPVADEDEAEGDEKVATPDPDGDSGKDSPVLVKALADIADGAQDRAGAEAGDVADDAPGGDGAPAPDGNNKAKTSPSFVISAAIDRQDTTVTALIGGTGTDAAGRAFDLTGATLSGGAATLVAETAVDRYAKFTGTRAGSVDDTSIGFVGGFNFGHLQLDTRVALGVTNAAGGGVASLSIDARTRLPAPDITDFEDALNEARSGITETDDAANLLADDLMPDPALLVPRDDWSVISRTEGEAGKIGFVIDVGLHTVNARTLAEVSDGAAPLTTGALSIHAGATGGLIVLRDIPAAMIGAEPETGDDTEAPGTDPVDADGTSDAAAPDTDPEDQERQKKARALGNAGLGGAFQYLRGRIDSRATLGALDASGGDVSLSALSVEAHNDTHAIAVAKSFGGAEKFGFNAGVAVVDHKGAAEAVVTDAVPFAVTGSTTIAAHEGARLFALGGAGTEAGKTSIGLGAGLVFADRTARAGLSGAPLAAVVAAGRPGAVAEGPIALANAEISAETAGYGAAGSVAGAAGMDAGDDSGDSSDDDNARGGLTLPEAVVGDRAEEHSDALDDQTTGDDAPGDEVDDKAFGFGLAADFSGVFGRNTAAAVLATDAPVTLTGLELTATNSAHALLAAGAAVASGGSIGLSGAATVSSVRTDVAALNLGGSRDMTGSITIAAHDRGDVVAAAAGRGGAESDFALVGSGAINLGRSDVRAQSQGSAITGDADISIDAVAEGALVALSGSLAAPEADEAKDSAVKKAGALVGGAVVGGILGGVSGAVDGAIGGITGGDGEDPDGEPAGDDDEEGSSFGIGIAFAANIRPETVVAEFGGASASAAALSVTASNTRSVLGLAAATGAKPDIAISGSVVVNAIDAETRARILGGGRMLRTTGTMEVRAETAIDALAQIGFQGSSATFGLGISAPVQNDRRRTSAEIINVDQGTAANDAAIVLAATTAGSSRIALVSAMESEGSTEDDAGESSSTGVPVALPVAVLNTNWETDAALTGGRTAAGTLAASAREAALVETRQTTNLRAGKTAAQVGASVVNHASQTRATVTGGVQRLDGAATITATAETILRAVALRDGEGENTGNLMVSVLNTTGATRALLRDATLVAGSLNIGATDRTIRDAYTNGAARSDSFGLAGGIVVDVYRRDTIARAQRSDIETRSGAIVLAALSEVKASTVTLGRNGGSGDSGGQGNITWTTDARDVLAELVSTTVQSDDDLRLTARRDDSYLALQGSDTRSASGVGIGLGVLRVHGLTVAQITGEGAVDVAGDAVMIAENAAQALQLGIGVTVGGTFAGVGSLGIVDFGQRPDSLPQVTGEDRGRGLRDLAEDVLNDSVAFIEDKARVTLPEFDFTRATEIAARLAPRGELRVGGDTVLRATDHRRADVLSGQVALVMDIGIASTLLDAFSIERDEETGKFRVRARPILPKSGDDGDAPDDETEVAVSDESEGAPLFDEMGAAEGDGDAGGEGGGGDDGGEGTSLGLGVAYARFGGVVAAEIDLDAIDGARITGDLTLEARSQTDGRAVSVGAGVLGNSLGAGGGVMQQAQLVRAAITGNGTLSARGVVVVATGENRIRAMAGVLQVGDGIAVGATLGAAELKARATAEVGQKAQLDIGKGGLRIEAGDTTRALGLGVAAAGSIGGSTGIAAANGVVLSATAVEALLRDAGATSGGDVLVLATRAQRLTGLAYNAAIATSGVGIGGGLGLGLDRGVTQALVQGASVAATGDVLVRARNATDVTTSAVGGSYGSSFSLAGSISLTLKEDEVTALIDGGTVAAGDAVVVEAVNGGDLGAAGGGDEGALGSIDQLTGSLSLSSSLALGISVGVIRSVADVTAAVRGGANVTSQAAGTGATGVSRREGAEVWRVRETVTHRGVRVAADNQTTMKPLAVTAAAALGTGISAQLPVVMARDTITAEITGGANANSGSDVSVFAGNGTDLRTNSFSLAGGLTAGVGVQTEAFLLAKQTVARIEGATVDAARDVSVVAVTPEFMRTTTVGAGIGLSLGLGITVQTGITRSTTLARIGAANVAAGRDVAVNAHAPRQFQNLVGTLGAGYVGVGAAQMFLISTDEVAAEITASTATAFRDASVTADARTIPFGRENRVLLPSGNGTVDANQTIVGFGGGLIGVSGAGLYTVARQTVIARIGAGTVLETGRNMALSARQSWSQDVFLMTQSGGFVGVGAAAMIGTMRSSVLAEVGDGAVVTAAGSVTIASTGERNFKGGVVAGGGGIFSFQGSGILLTYGKPIRVDEDSADLPDVQENIDEADAELNRDLARAPAAEEDGPTPAFAAGDAILSFLLGDITAQRQAVNLDAAFNGTGGDDAILTRIGGNAQITGSSVDVSANEGGTLNVLAGGVSIGAIAPTHGVALVRRGTALTVDVGMDARITARTGSLRLAAVADVDDGTPEAIAGGIGLITSGAAISDIRIGRSLDVRLGARATLVAVGALSVTAEETTATTARVTGAAIGGIGVGVAIATAYRDSTVTVDLGRGTLTGAAVSVAARRNGAVQTDVNLVSIGAIAIGATSASARDRSVVTVNLGRATLEGAVTVRALNAGDVLADARGDIIGLGTTGAHYASARRQSETRILGTQVVVKASSFDLLASDNDTAAGGTRGRIVATTRTSTVSLGSLGGALTRARNESLVRTDLRFGSFNVTGDAVLDARSETDLEYVSSGVTISGVGIGLTRAVGRDTSTVQSILNFTAGAQVGGNFAARAGGDAYLFGNAVAGTGGLVSAYASLLELDLISVTELVLRGATITADAIELRLDRGLIFESNSDSLNVSLADVGATQQTNTVDARTLLDLGASLAARTITVTADTNITKRAIDFNGVSGSFGGFNRAALASRTWVMADADLVVQSGVTITQAESGTPAPGAEGGVQIGIGTSYDLTDRLRGDIGAAVGLPVVNSEIIVGDPGDTAARATSDLRLAGVTILAEGDVAVTHRTDALMNSESYAKIYALGGRGGTDAITTLRHSATTTLEAGSITSRRGDVRVLAGADTTGTQAITQYAETRIHNRSVVPLASNPEAAATSDFRARIDLRENFTIAAGRDVALEAGRGVEDLYAYSFAIDAYSEAAQAVANFFGGLLGASEVSLGREGGTITRFGSAGVRLDGTVTAGAFPVTRLEVALAPGVDWDEVDSAEDLVIETEGEVDYSLDFNRNVGARIDTFIADLTARRNAYDQGDSTWEALNDQIAALQARRAFLASTGGLVEADFLTLPSLFAQGGRVTAAGDYLAGEGTVTAVGDALIEVINNASVSIEVGDATIPFRETGTLRFNGALAQTNADLLQLGAARIVQGPGGVTTEGPAFAIAAAGLDAPPNINLRSNYVSTGGPTADIYVTGDIETLTGNVTIRTEDGSVYVFGGNINAASVTIDSGGDFFLAPSDPVTHIGFDPRGGYADSFAEQIEYQALVFNEMRRDPSITESQARGRVLVARGLVPPAQTLPDVTAQGSITAVGNIFVYARVININGAIRSGITDWSLTVNASIDPLLNSIRSIRTALGDLSPVEIYRPLRGTPLGSDADTSNVEVVGLNPVASLPGDAHMTGNVSVNFDVENNRLVVLPVTTRGGFIEISGEIVSTGQGSITAANGFGRLSVNSASARDLEFTRVDLGPEGGVTGTIRIIDRARPIGFFSIGGTPEAGAPQRFLTTTYTATADGRIATSTNGLLIGNNTPTVTAAFNPVDDTALFFTTAEDTQVTRTITRIEVRERSGCVQFLGCGPITTPAPTVQPGETVTVSLPDKPDVGYIRRLGIDLDASPDRAYRFTAERSERNSTLLSRTESGFETTNSIFGFWTRQQNTIVETRSFTERRIYTHRLKADEPIAIGFDGHTTSRADITATGSVLFNGQVRNLTGRLGVTTGGDIRSLDAGVTLQTQSAIFEAAGAVTGATPSRIPPREFTIPDDVVAREIFGRDTGADLTPGQAAYRNELVAAIDRSAPPATLMFGGDLVSVNIEAVGAIRIRQGTGAFEIAQVSSTFSRDVQIEAVGDIRETPFGGTIAGGRVVISSETGSVGVQPNVGTAGDPRLRVEADTSLRIEAEGDIEVVSASGLMRIEQIRSRAGDVTVETDISSIRDVDDRETADRRAQAGLLAALWSELGLVDDGTLSRLTSAERAALRDAEVARRTEEYRDFWEVLVVRDKRGQVIDVADYDSRIVVRLSETELATLRARGATQQEIGKIEEARTAAFHAAAPQYEQFGYDKGFQVPVTAAEMTPIWAAAEAEKAIAVPAVQIEARLLTERYHQVWDALAVRDPDTGEVRDFLRYNPDLKPFQYTSAQTAEMLANGLTRDDISELQDRRNARFHQDARNVLALGDYDPDYQFVPDAAFASDVRARAYFTTTELEASFRRDLILPVLDTQITIEEPNIIGRDVTIISALDVGEVIDPIIKLAGSLLTTADRLALFSAERADIIIEPDRVIIRRNDDLDVIASGRLSVQATRHVYVGSESDIALARLVGTQDVRLRTSGAITMAPGGTGVTGRAVGLEAAGGGIGSALSPLRIGLLSGGSVAARAAGGIYLDAPETDLRVAEIFTPGVLSLQSTRDIVGAGAAGAVNILAGDVRLNARRAISGLRLIPAAAVLPENGVPGAPPILLLDAKAANGLELQVDGGTVRATRLDAGALDLDIAITGGNLVLLRASEAPSAVPVVSRNGQVHLTVSGDIIDAEPFGVALRAGKTLDLVARGMGSAATPLILEAEALTVLAHGGRVHLASPGDLRLAGLGGTGPMFDIVAGRDLVLDGDVLPGTATARVVLTALRGGVSASRRIDIAGQMTLTALEGGVEPLFVRQLGGKLSVAAVGPVMIDAASPLEVGYAVSETGNVTLISTDKIEVALIGSVRAPILTPAPERDSYRWGDGTPLDTRPEGDIQTPDLYPLMEVAGEDAKSGGDTGGGDTGGGDTGGGDTGGGDTGGGDTGGGDTGGGDTGGGDTGGGDTGGGDTGGGDTGGGDTGGGDTGGGDTGGGDTGGGDTGGGDTGGGDTGGGDTGGGDTGGGDTGGGDTGGGDTGGGDTGGGDTGGGDTGGGDTGGGDTGGGDTGGGDTGGGDTGGGDTGGGDTGGGDTGGGDTGGGDTGGGDTGGGDTGGGDTGGGDTGGGDTGGGDTGGDRFDRGRTPFSADDRLTIPQGRERPGRWRDGDGRDPDEEEDDEDDESRQNDDEEEGRQDQGGAEGGSNDRRDDNDDRRGRGRDGLLLGGFGTSDRRG